MLIPPDLLRPFDNYISRGTETFLSNRAYLEMVFNMYKSVLSADHLSERTVADGVQLIEVVLQHCRGRVDQIIEPVLEIALTKLGQAKRTFLKVLLVETVRETMTNSYILGC